MDKTETTKSRDPQQKVRLCKRPGSDAPREINTLRHRAKMNAKRDNRPKVKPGYRVVPNLQIDGAISALSAVLQIGSDISGPLKPHEADAEARRQIARNLPARRRDFFMPAGTTKNNDASYRTGGSITGDGSRAAARAKLVKKPRKSRAKKAAA